MDLPGSPLQLPWKESTISEERVKESQAVLDLRDR
jgi:hypothetical protein